MVKGTVLDEGEGALYRRSITYRENIKLVLLLFY